MNEQNKEWKGGAALWDAFLTLCSVGGRRVAFDCLPGCRCPQGHFPELGSSVLDVYLSFSGADNNTKLSQQLRLISKAKNAEGLTGRFLRKVEVWGKSSVFKAQRDGLLALTARGSCDWSKNSGITCYQRQTGALCLTFSLLKVGLELYFEIQSRKLYLAVENFQISDCAIGI